jgi:hypothetical protein|tara:strand:+ start:385 stop:711 length:327 start_codon:yes stop_codon:yes gene_type:complete
MQTKKPSMPGHYGFFHITEPVTSTAESALTRLETAVGFVDNVNASFAAYHATIAMTLLRGLERVQDFHCPDPNNLVNSKAGTYWPRPALSIQKRAEFRKKSRFSLKPL